MQFDRGVMEGSAGAALHCMRKHRQVRQVYIGHVVSMPNGLLNSAM